MTSMVLRIMSFAAAILVVAIHSNSLSAIDSPAQWNVNFHYWLCVAPNQWVVPYFFVVSGFWFALGKYSRRGGVKVFYLKKMKTLLVPYLLWAGIAAVLAQPVIIGNNIVTHKSLLDRSVFEMLSNPIEFFNSLFAITKGSPRHNIALWYIRSLFVLFLLAPLWRLFCNKKTAWLLLLALIVVRKYFIQYVIPCISVRIGGPAFYFMLGIVIASYLPNKLVSQNSTQWSLSHLPSWINFSFWIYCSHTIFLSYIIAMFHYFIGKSDVAIAACTFLSIPTATVLSIISAIYVKHHLPALFCRLNGFR